MLVKQTYADLSNDEVFYSDRILNRKRDIYIHEIIKYYNF